MSNIIYYIFAILGVVLFASSVQSKKKKDILGVQTFASLCYMIAYIVKHAWSGVATEVVEQVKNIVFIQYEKKNKKIPFYFLIIFCFLLIIIACVTYNGILSMIPLLINLSYFVGTYIKNPKYIRIVVFCCAILWAIYNYSIGAYIIIIGNVLEMVSSAISLVRNKD